MAQVTDPYEYCETTAIGDVPVQDADPPQGEDWLFQERVVIGSITVFRWRRPANDVRRRAREAWLNWTDEDVAQEMRAWKELR